ncbi:recombinase family protein [Nostoc sp. 'Peltigera membranacea cyanobiont' 210A]|uniref:recombinase family protein n=1 Tax=Nostoc sp. 'Peltigera membranacea cyanobiont' 210A TaxID=2014529 RepID=UPI000B95BD04|nr:recombinase family protein [Nostoc sp. 'Peltigera membranacea cyanobiont' 210A]OYD91591.1 recombinase family protein [Nostoc sp. 'Peltigera membranacea cyanobiont' 210A]
MNNKISSTHLERRAVVYLRQSTPNQVEFNRESTERQYALADRALTLGWDKSQISVLDSDLGKSGQTTTGREDFHRLMAAVGLGEVGAVLALEASRFSRSQADWHKLLDICALTDTLVIDHDGIYDPNDFNDRVILGFKGTWSHTELHGMRLRLQGAKLNKAKKGELRCSPPTGYVYDPEGKLVLDPDESVVGAIQLAFQQFRELRTAFKVMRYFCVNQIPFPRRRWRPGDIGTLHWGKANLSRITALLHNPTYTGTYVYGRRRSFNVIEAGQIKKVKIQQLPQEEWKVIIHNAHEAYISWSEYLSNCERLRRNCPISLSDGCPGTPREGFALLQGLVICGKCGRRMSPRYHGTGGCRAAYECTQARKQDGSVGACWSVAGAAIDTAVSAHVLSAFTDEQLDISLAVLSELENIADEADKTWQLRLERARYEADRAFRQYDATEPENRLVVRTLERRWNEKLQQLAELEEAYQKARLVQRLELTAVQRQQILQLANDIPTLWHASTTTNLERKEILGLLVKQVAITPIDAPERSTRIQILWHTGATSELIATRPTNADKYRTPNEVIQLIEELAPGRTDTKIADELNRRGLVGGTGRAFTKKGVAWIRWKFGIDKPLSDPSVAKSGVSPEGYYSTSALAKKLGVGIHTVYYWRDKGIIQAFQETPRSPWWYIVTPEVLETLREKIRRVPVKSE